MRKAAEYLHVDSCRESGGFEKGTTERDRGRDEKRRGREERRGG
jgi:hypothetical protein